MIISQLILNNWKNFRHINVTLGDRVFVVGPNAAGKSNFLDVFRFLRDLVKPAGGLQAALESRGGLSKIRCLAARKNPQVEIEIGLSEGVGGEEIWRYSLGIKKEPKGQHLSIIDYEKVWHAGKLILNRPDEEDLSDKLRLTQTHLEQINANKRFRDVAIFLQEIQYLHLVPQAIRHPIAFVGKILPDDPYGQDFLKRLSDTSERSRDSRLRKIEEALRGVVPQLTRLSYTKDDMGKPHLEALYEHWRPRGAKQLEDQFSDGTLRMIGLLWSLLDKDSVLLLEEPELSLHTGIVRRLPAIMSRLNRKSKRQIMLSTHSPELLADGGIGGEEVLLLEPSTEGTQIKLATDYNDIRALLEQGLSAADAILPKITQFSSLPLWQELDE